MTTRGEYDAEAGTILGRLRSNASVEEVTTIVHEEFIEWFERETTGPRRKYSAVTAEILRVYAADSALQA
jgi:hypothetical protein